jgi:hypothetical protein
VKFIENGAGTVFDVRGRYHGNTTVRQLAGESSSADGIIQG